MENQLKPEQIHGKKLVAVAGYEIFGKQLITTVNKELEDKNLLLIGINIRDEDFDFFIRNLAKSKVETTIFLPEFQKRSAEFYGVEGYLIAVYKKDDKMKFLTDEQEIFMDDTNLIRVIKTVEGV